MKALTKKADIITPNLTELCILCDADYKEITEENNIEKIAYLASSLLNETTQIVVVTGVKSSTEIINLVIDKNGINQVKSTLLKGSFSGTGDIFSSVVCGAVTKGVGIIDAVRLATNFITESIKSTPTDLNYEPDGVNFQKHLGMLINAK